MTDPLTKPGEFFLGRVFDPALGKTSDKALIYKADDLTTHAVVVGMTGSGKTGLCIGLLEEAALDGLPAMMIDPKGDLTNLLLHFPELRPQDFQPWINTDLARRAGIGIDEVARQEADKWKKGLEDWGIGHERLLALQQAAQFAIYTPGSDAGLPVSILASLQAPTIPWDANKELLREKISGTVTAILGLVGLKDIDPVRSREHILLSNIFENAWKAGSDLDLGELILQTQTPPFQKLGVFDINTFYPQKDRFDLAMQLNNILAAPSFQTWIEGQPLDIAQLMRAPDGRPRHSVFYIAHLTDDERMFFVTLLFSAIEAWMRSQTGSPSLRTLVYFDEIFGYLPPIANPPSKQVMLRMLKQARAFGVGLVLATQNPVDMDYKGLSNTGTWMIGKLQTDQDKQRLLDGLEGAAPGSFDRKEYDHMISGIGKRVFLLHNVHESKPVLFSTRWAMNYLAGPLTRPQIPVLNTMVGAISAPQVESSTSPVLKETGTTASGKPIPSVTPPLETSQTEQKAKPKVTSSVTRPALPVGVAEYFLPSNVSFPRAFEARGRIYSDQAKNLGLVYHPVLLGQVSIRYINRSYNLDVEQRSTILLTEPDRRGIIRWEENLVDAIDMALIENQPDEQARFTTLEAPLSDAKLMANMKKDFLDWIYRSGKVVVRVNETLKIYAGPNVTDEEFQNECASNARKIYEKVKNTVIDSFEKRLDAIKVKMNREQRELEGDEAELSQRKTEEYGTHLETIIGLFGGRKRRLTSSLSKRRMTAQAKADVQESKEAIDDYEAQIVALEREQAKALQELQDQHEAMAKEVKEITITPLKKDILLECFGVAWYPYHIARIENDELELPAFSYTE
jgi:hypothetical protein